MEENRVYAVFQHYGGADYTQRSIWFEEREKAIEYIKDNQHKGKLVILEQIKEGLK